MHVPDIDIDAIVHSVPLPSFDIGGIGSGRTDARLSIDLLTMLAACTALFALVAGVLLGLFLRHRAHVLSEQRMMKLMQALLIALLVAVGVPVVRWLSLLSAIRAGGGPAVQGFSLAVVPVMAATGVAQASMIGSWILYRLQIATEDREDY